VQEGGSLPGTPAGGLDERDAGSGIPVAGLRIEVQKDQAGTLQIPFLLRDVVFLDHRRGYPLAVRVEQEPKPAVEASIPAQRCDKHLPRAQLRGSRIRESLIPRKADPILLRHLIRVKDADLAGVSVLRSSRHEPPIFFRDRHRKRAAAKGQQVSSGDEILADRLPHAGRQRGTIGEYEQVCILEGAGPIEIGYPGENSLHITECLLESRPGHGLAFDGGESVLPEDDDFGIGRRIRSQ
jgi:hypothetical protein